MKKFDRDIKFEKMTNKQALFRLTNEELAIVMTSKPWERLMHEMAMSRVPLKEWFGQEASLDSWFWDALRSYGIHLSSLYVY